MDLEVKGRIGQGAYADVYEATDELGRSLAVKFIETGMVDQEFIREQARALARIDSEHVVDVVCFARLSEPDSGDEKPAIVLEYVPGDTLEDELNRMWSPEEAEGVIRSMISGLKDIHDAGLVHGDLHGGNVLVQNGGAQLIDPLYENSLASLKRKERKEAVSKDVSALRRMVNSILTVSDIPRASRQHFKGGMVDCETVSDVEELFEEAITEGHSNETVSEAPERIKSSDLPLLLAVIRREDGLYTRGIRQREDSRAETIREVKGAYVACEEHVWKWETPERLVRLGGEIGDETRLDEKPVKTLKMRSVGERPDTVLKSLEGYDFVGTLWDFSQSFDLLGIVPRRMYYLSRQRTYSGGAHGHTVVRFLCREIGDWVEVEPFRDIDVERLEDAHEREVIKKTGEKAFRHSDPELTVAYPNLDEQGKLTMVCQFTVSAPYACSDGRWDSYTISERIRDRKAATRFPERGEVPDAISAMASMEDGATVLGWTRGHANAIEKYRQEI